MALVSWHLIRSGAVYFCFAVPVAAQQLPPLDPANELVACRGQVEWNVNNARIGAGYAEQFRVEGEALKKQVADLKKRLAEAEEKVPKEETP